MRSLLLLAIIAAPASAWAEETYRLVHAVGNVERIAGRNLSKDECEKRKAELKAVASALGTGGSITCLPESFFQ